MANGDDSEDSRALLSRTIAGAGITRPGEHASAGTPLPARGGAHRWQVLVPPGVRRKFAKPLALPALR